MVVRDSKSKERYVFFPTADLLEIAHAIPHVGLHKIDVSGHCTHGRSETLSLD